MIKSNKKNIILLVLITVGICSFIAMKSLEEQNTTIKANEIDKELVNKNESSTEVSEDVWTEEELDEYFSHVDDSELILFLPDGGYIYSRTDPSPGVADAILHDENGNPIEYDIDTDPNSETVAEAKQRMLGQPIKYE